MKVDKYGQIILNENDICDIFMRNQYAKINHCLVESIPKQCFELELNTYPKIISYIEQSISLEQFDKLHQQNWYMPDTYKELDVAEWLLSKCTDDDQLQRVGHELLMFMERDLFDMLKYLKYLVDTLRQHHIVWGVGRGSSVSSYVLYLIGVHKIDSMYYDLDISEFLK